MSARIMGSIDIIAGVLLLLVRGRFGPFTLPVVIIAVALIGKGFMSWI